MFVVLSGFTAQAAELNDDRMLTFQIRRHLDQDDKLKSFNIGVRVREGVVTLIGRLPTSELRLHAEQRVQAMPGVQSVHDELLVGREPEQPTLQIPLAVSLPTPPSSRPVALLAPEIVEVVGQPSGKVPTHLTAQVEPLDRRSPLPESDESVRDAVNVVRWSEPRFLRIDLHIKDGLVTLSGYVPRGEDSRDLARMLSRVRGVTGVIIETREATPLPGRTP
jgi:osmotically-inducible protein OsmY